MQLGQNKYNRIAASYRAIGLVRLQTVFYILSLIGLCFNLILF